MTLVILGPTLALCLPTIATYLVLRSLWTHSEPPLSGGLAAALAPGLGTGVASCVYFMLLLLARDNRAAVRLDAGFWLLTSAFLVAHRVRLKRSGEPATTDGPGGTSVTGWRVGVGVNAAGFAILVTLAGVSFWQHWAVTPHGEWDAWAIWNLRGRAILRGAPDWYTVLSPAIGWSHTDYPLLLPLTNARLWAYAGRESTVGPAVVAMLFSASSLAVLVISVGRLRGWSAGFLSGMALLMARTYVFQSSCQCGDVPIGFFVLVAICFVAMSRQTDGPAGFLFVAGAAAGLAAWTKNDGALVLILVVLAATLSRSPFRRLASIAAGAAIPLLAIAIFKLHLAPSSNYLFDAQIAGGIGSRLLDHGRWALVTSRLAHLLPVWGEVPGGALTVVGVAVALSAGPDRLSIGRAMIGLLLVTAIFFGYGLVYVITPLPVEWQISTSFDRLFTQLWPALLWTSFQCVGSRPPAQTPAVF